MDPEVKPTQVAPSSHVFQMSLRLLKIRMIQIKQVNNGFYLLYGVSP